MFAVVETGGKQYRVAVGDRVKVERLAGEAGEAVSLGRVLMIADGDDVSVGNPVLEGRTVEARVLAQGRGEKIRIFKMKRRKGYRRSQGHRQAFTELEITSID